MDMIIHPQTAQSSSGEQHDIARWENEGGACSRTSQECAARNERQASLLFLNNTQPNRFAIRTGQDDRTSWPDAGHASTI